jgi:hypothetical protein
MEIAAALSVGTLPDRANVTTTDATPNRWEPDFTELFVDAVRVQSPEPSPWTLVNPVVAQKTGRTETAEPAEENPEPAEKPEQLALVPLPSPVLVRKLLPELALSAQDFVNVAKPLHDSKTATVNPEVATSTDPATQQEGFQRIPEQAAQSAAPPPRHIAFTARVSKADNALQPAETIKIAAPSSPVSNQANQLPRSYHYVRGTEMHTSPPTPDADHSELNVGTPVSQTWRTSDMERSPDAEHSQVVSGPEQLRESPDVSNAEPVRRISVEVGGTGGQLRIRISERAGEMRAWVMGQAPATVEKVQAGLSELTRALTNAGFDAEISAPSRVNAPTAATHVQASTEQTDHNAFGGSHGDTSGDRHSGGRGSRHSQHDDEEDEQGFRSEMKIF